VCQGNEFSYHMLLGSFYILNWWRCPAHALCRAQLMRRGVCRGGAQFAGGEQHNHLPVHPPGNLHACCAAHLLRMSRRLQTTNVLRKEDLLRAVSFPDVNPMEIGTKAPGENPFSMVCAPAAGAATASPRHCRWPVTFWRSTARAATAPCTRGSARRSRRRPRRRRCRQRSSAACTRATVRRTAGT
jgi:hypothetical protein